MIKKIIFLAILLLCVAMRIATPGWLLILGFWLIAVPYLLHIFAIFTALNEKMKSPAKLVLLIISTFFLVIYSLFQYDCNDVNCIYVYENILSMLQDGKYDYTEPSEAAIVLLAFIPGFTVVVLDLLIFIVHRKLKKKLA